MNLLKNDEAIFVSKLFLIDDRDDFKEDVVIEFNDQGLIRSIMEGAAPSDVNERHNRFVDGIATSTFVNAHTHVMDTFGKGMALGRSLDEVVGLKGLKFEILSNLSSLERQVSLELVFSEFFQSGVNLFFDFREEGLHGIRLLKEALSNFPELDGIILGRPLTSDELDELCVVADGIGLSTPNLYSDVELSHICEIARKNNKWIATHLMESSAVISESRIAHGKSDLERAVELLRPDIVVHLTQATVDELEIVESVAKLMVFCPRSNAFFGLGVPPIHWCIENGLPFGLGSDNALTTTLDVLSDARWMLLRLAESRHHLFCQEMLQEFYKALTEYPTMQLGLKQGPVKRGHPASFIIWDARSPRFYPLNNFLEHLLLRSSKKDIIQVYSKGKAMLR